MGDCHSSDPGSNPGPGAYNFYDFSKERQNSIVNLENRPNYASLLGGNSPLVENKIDFGGFKEYLQSQGKKNSKQILLNAKKYGYVLEKNDASELLTLSKTKRHHVMEAIVALSKFQGKYPQWKALRERYQLKWGESDSLEVFQSIFNNENDYPAMLGWLKDTISKIPKPYANILIYDTLTGLRPNEACQSISLIQADLSNYLKQDKMILEHYRYPSIFIRNSKKAFISVINEQIIQIAKEAHNCGYTALRNYLKKRNLDMNMAYCRKIFATHMRKNGIESEIIDLLQGRIPKSVFARHYFRPDFDKETNRMREIILELNKEIYS